MDINEFRRMLKFSRHRLDDELERNAETLEHIGRALAQANANELALKDKRDRALARALADLRDRSDKLTVAAAEAEAKRSKPYMDANEAYQEGKQEAEEWDHLFTSWKQRGNDLRTMAQLYGAQYFAVRDGGSSHGRDLREMRQVAAIYERPRHRFSEGAELAPELRRRKET